MPKLIVISVKVIPNAKRNEIVGWENEELKIRIKAVPEDGKANEELIRFLAKTLKISKSQIEIVRGHTSRHKQLAIQNPPDNLLFNNLDH